MPQRRKTGTTTLPVIGGNKIGVVVTDPGGHQQILAFDADGTAGFLRADGTFTPVPADETVWGTITGTLSNQTDLQAALDAKQNLLVFDTTLQAYVLDADQQPTVS